jgi:hypothetical protein
VLKVNQPSEIAFSIEIATEEEVAYNLIVLFEYICQKRCVSLQLFYIFGFKAMWREPTIEFFRLSMEECYEFLSRDICYRYHLIGKSHPIHFRLNTFEPASIS